MNIQDQKKFCFLRAKQYYDDLTAEYTPTETQKPKDFTTHFKVTVEASKKRKIPPWIIEKSLEKFLGGKAKLVRSLNETIFSVEVANKKQSDKMLEYKQITDEVECITEVANNIFFPQGTAYLYEYDLEDDEKFKDFREEFI